MLQVCLLESLYLLSFPFASDDADSLYKRYKVLSKYTGLGG